MREFAVALFLALALALAAFYTGVLVDENKALQALLDIRTGCTPQHEGEIAAAARRGSIVECAITDGSGGRRHVISRFSYAI